jgi:hypothetical protein
MRILNSPCKNGGDNKNQLVSCFDDLASVQVFGGQKNNEDLYVKLI